MINGIKTYFDTIYESLSEINEDFINLFNTPDYIWYGELEYYFSKYYFSAGKTSLLPPIGDFEGWETVKNLREIEKHIPPGKTTKSRGMTRIGVFYNTYVIEHWLIKNTLKLGTIFSPDNERGSDEADYRSLPSHEYLRKGPGDDIPDFTFTRDDGKVITSDLKVLTKDQIGNMLVDWNAHGADFVLAYNPYNNKLTAYIFNKALSDKSKYSEYMRVKNGEIDLDKELPNKLIPWKILGKDLYKSWDSIFELYNISNKKEEE